MSQKKTLSYAADTETRKNLKARGEMSQCSSGRSGDETKRPKTAEQAARDFKKTELYRVRQAVAEAADATMLVSATIRARKKN